MQTQFALPPSQPAENMGSRALLKLLIARHPHATALFFLVYWLALLLASSRLLSPIYYATHMPLLLYQMFGEVFLALIVILPVALLRWWPEVGLARGVNGRGILLCLLPALLIVGPELLALPLVVGNATALILIVSLVLSLLVGFAEEGMFRGVILCSLLPRGIWPAVLLSSLCFASVHLTNLLGGASWGYIFNQLISTAGVGVLFAALRLRTGSLWPGILLHAAHDIVGMIVQGMNPTVIRFTPSTASYVYTFIFALVFLFISAVLLRSSQVRKLEIAYGLVKQPATIMPGNLPYSFPQGYPAYPAPPAQPFPASSADDQPLPYPGSMAYREYTSPEAYKPSPSQESQ